MSPGVRRSFISSSGIVTLNSFSTSTIISTMSRLSAFVSSIREKIDFEFSVDNYHEQAIGKGANARALAFVPIKLNEEEIETQTEEDEDDNSST